MFLAISITYLAAVTFIMLFQFRCYKRSRHLLYDPHPTEHPANSVTPHMA